jgi:hypothetical protein
MRAGSGEVCEVESVKLTGVLIVVRQIKSLCSWWTDSINILRRPHLRVGNWRGGDVVCESRWRSVGDAGVGGKERGGGRK